MVITENDSDEILALDRTSITIAERDHAKETPRDRRFRKKRIHCPRVSQFR